MFDMTEGFHPTAPAPPHGGAPTWLWTRRREVGEAIHRRNHHPHCLSGITLPSGLGATTDMPHALHGAQRVILAVPSAATRHIARQAVAVRPCIAVRPYIGRDRDAPPARGPIYA